MYDRFLVNEYYTGSSARVAPNRGPRRLIKSGTEERAGGGHQPNRPNRPNPLPSSAFKIHPAGLGQWERGPCSTTNDPNRQSRGPPAMSLHLTVVLEFSNPRQRVKLRHAHWEPPRFFDFLYLFFVPVLCTCSLHLLFVLLSCIPFLCFSPLFLSCTSFFV